MPSTNPGLNPPAATNPDSAAHRRQIVEYIVALAQGRIQCLIDVTLAPNVATTTLNDSRISAFTAVVPASALTASGAAAQAAGIYITGQAKGTCVLNHRNNAAADQTIRFVILG